MLSRQNESIHMKMFFTTESFSVANQIHFHKKGLGREDRREAGSVSLKKVTRKWTTTDNY